MEPIECPACEGCGFHSHEGLDGYEVRTECRKCQGTGEVPVETSEGQ